MHTRLPAWLSVLSLYVRVMCASPWHWPRFIQPKSGQVARTWSPHQENPYRLIPGPSSSSLLGNFVGRHLPPQGLCASSLVRQPLFPSAQSGCPPLLDQVSAWMTPATKGRLHPGPPGSRSGEGPAWGVGRHGGQRVCPGAFRGVQCTSAHSQVRNR